MKKLYTLMMALAVIFVLTACQSSPAEEPVSSSQPETYESQTEETVSPAETFESARGKEENTENTEGTSVSVNESETVEEMEENTMKIQIGDTVFTAILEDNSSAEALKELLMEGPLTIDMSDSGNMEKVGPIGTSLPTNDEHISTVAGDIILYQGNSLVIYYNTNTWNFTRLGKINGVTQSELMEVLGDGNVTVTLTLE